MEASWNLVLAMGTVKVTTLLFFSFSSIVVELYFGINQAIKQFSIVSWDMMFVEKKPFGQNLCILNRNNKKSSHLLSMCFSLKKFRKKKMIFKCLWKEVAHGLLYRQNPPLLLYPAVYTFYCNLCLQKLNKKCPGIKIILQSAVNAS